MGLPTCILFWDVDGNVIGTLDYMVSYDEQGRPLGLVDFEAFELAGGRLREVAEHGRAVGSGTWPEWIGGQAMDFKVEVRAGGRGGTHMITALRHKVSGHRRDRVAIQAAVDEAMTGKGPGDVVDLRPVLGGPGRSLRLDREGRSVARVPRGRPVLPLRPVEKR